MNNQPLSVLLHLIQPEQYIGDVYAISYDDAMVQVHDFYRQLAGGLPRSAFLLATRLTPNSTAEIASEEGMIILLRVLEPAVLPSHDDAQRVRIDVAQRIAGDASVHWDDAVHMDATTHHFLSFSAIRCRILGTFFLDADISGSGGVGLRFGSDLANYYPNQGLKVYKPTSTALETIVNYVEPAHSTVAQRVVVGTVRYTSTQHPAFHHSPVPVTLSPADLFGQKTALFGMTRSGKSNTTKILLQAVFSLRFADQQPQRIGQLIFDANGEYANDNMQDVNQHNCPSSLRRVWRMHPQGTPADVVTYGLVSQSTDPHRRLMLLNFLATDNLATGKALLDNALALDSAKFIQNFRQVRFDPPNEHDRHSADPAIRHAFFRALTRYRRHILVYRTLLICAGFVPPPTLRVKTIGLFNGELLAALEHSENEQAPAYAAAASILRKIQPTWEQVATALATLTDFMLDRSSGFATFETQSMSGQHASGESWADETLKKLLVMFRYPNGVRQLGRLATLHTPSTTCDYAHDICRDLAAGRMVIVDHSVGDAEATTAAAERIMYTLFQAQQRLFRNGIAVLPHILIYLEEAHLLLPAGSDHDLNNIWVRTAKEGAKYHLGMVYATQEVSSIQHNILANTANWFIGHLNHRDETRELCKMEEFADFEVAIRCMSERGLVRMKTISNRFVIPVQICKFEF